MQRIVRRGGGKEKSIVKWRRALLVLGQPFTRWSIRKLSDYVATKRNRKVIVGRERLRQTLAEEKNFASGKLN